MELQLTYFTDLSAQFFSVEENDTFQENDTFLFIQFLKQPCEREWLVFNTARTCMFYNLKFKLKSAWKVFATSGQKVFDFIFACVFLTWSSFFGQASTPPPPNFNSKTLYFSIRYDIFCRGYKNVIILRKIVHRTAQETGDSISFIYFWDKNAQ